MQMESKNQELRNKFLEKREIQRTRLLPIIQVETKAYKSGLELNEQILIEAFLFLLKKENIIYTGVFEENGYSFLDTLYYLIDKSNNPFISKLFYNHIESICKGGRKLYWNSIGHTYANLNLDAYSKDELPGFFDSFILRPFVIQKGGEETAMQPKEFNTLMNYFIPKDKKIKYYNPFAGTSSLSLNLPSNVTYFGEEINKTNWLLGNIRMLIYECPSQFTLENKNSIKSWASTKNIKHDYISFNPPFNLKIDQLYIDFLDAEEYGLSINANSLIISECFKKLKDEGRMVFLIPNSFFSPYYSKEISLIADLVDNNYVHTVIALPQHLLEFTSIAVNLVVLSKEANRSKEVTFIDASNCLLENNSRNNKIDVVAIQKIINSEKDNDFKKKITNLEIASNGYSLLVNRYVFEEPNLKVENQKYLMKLDDLKTAILKNKAKVTIGKYIRIRDLSSNPIDFRKTFDNLEVGKLITKKNICKLKPKALLLATTWNDLKPTIYDGNGEDIYYAYSDILAIELNEELVNPEYLVLELKKEYIEKQLERLRTGITVSRISRKDLLSIEIIIPSLEEQREKIYSYRARILQAKQTKVEELAKSYNIDVADENSFLRHQIAGRLRNARGAFKSIKTILDQKLVSQIPELYGFKLNDTLNINLGDYFQILERDLNNINQSVNVTGDAIGLSSLNVERIGLIKFISKYVDEIKSRTSNIFNIDKKIDENALIEHQVKEVYINGDKELLRRLFDNIIDNAEKHGFNKTISHKNKIEVDFIYNFEDMEVQIDFTNTGKPLPEDYSFEAFTRKGSKTGKFAGDGYGGWLMHEIMKKHGGNFGFTDETGPEGIGYDWATTIELTFPIEINI